MDLRHQRVTEEALGGRLGHLTARLLGVLGSDVRHDAIHTRSVDQPVGPALHGRLGGVAEVEPHVIHDQRPERRARIEEGEQLRAFPFGRDDREVSGG